MEQPTTSAATPGPSDAPPPETPAGSATASATAAEPIWRLYLLCLATFGLYLAWKAFRIARRLDPRGREDRARCLMWAFGALFPGAACAVLYETSRLARLEVVALGLRPRGGSLLVAPVLYLVLGGGLLVSRASSLMAPFAILLPIPFLIVQAELNELEAARAAREPPAPARRSWWPWLALALGLPVSALAARTIDGTGLIGLVSARDIHAGAVIESKSPRFRMQAPPAGWEQVGPGVVGDGDERFGFRKRGGTSWVVVYVGDDASGGLDDLVAGRREVIRASGARVLSFTEARTFLPQADMVPSALVRHDVVVAGTKASFLSFGAILENRSVEAVGFTQGGADFDVVMDFVRSVRPGAAGQKGGP